MTEEKAKRTFDEIQREYDLITVKLDVRGRKMVEAGFEGGGSSRGWEEAVREAKARLGRKVIEK